MAKEKENNAQSINFTLDPSKVPVYTVDSYLIGSDSNNLKLNFAQGALDGTQQHVVVRISMTPAQAKEFSSNLNDHMEKFEI